MTKRREGHTLVALWLPGEGEGGGGLCTHKQSKSQIQAGADEIFLLIDACHENTDSLLFGFS